MEEEVGVAGKDTDKLQRINSLIALKREADLHALKLEAHLHDLEAEYQRETGGTSIVRGLDGYLGIRSTTSTPLPPSSTRNRRSVACFREEDRIFSRAALTPMRRPLREFSSATSSAEDDYERERTEEDEVTGASAGSEDDSEYGSGNTFTRRRQR